MAATTECDLGRWKLSGAAATVNRPLVGAGSSPSSLLLPLLSVVGEGTLRERVVVVVVVEVKAAVEVVVVVVGLECRSFSDSKASSPSSDEPRVSVEMNDVCIIRYA